jgi:CDP-diacylglycerol--glycerol-3-phosphate 3-phosphatidyltransferase
VSGSLVSAATRDRVRGLATPIAKGLGRLGLTPNALTLIGFAGTCVAAWTAANLQWLVAGILVLAFGIFDLFDGTLARATGRATRLGAFLDSTFDRAGEGIVYIGIAAGSLAAGFEPGAILAASAMAASFMVSYTRAKAESLGFSSGTGMANVGLAPREVRLAILSLGLILIGIEGGHMTRAIDCLGVDAATIQACADLAQVRSATILVATLGLITILATVTTLQRILVVRAQSKEG